MMPSMLKGVHANKGREGKEEGHAFELSCIFANCTNLLLPQIHMREDLCLQSEGH